MNANGVRYAARRKSDWKTSSLTYCARSIVIYLKCFFCLVSGCFDSELKLARWLSLPGTVELFAFDFQAGLDLSSIWSGRTWTGNVPVKAEGKKKHPSDAERDSWISRFSTVTPPLLERNAYKRL